MRLHTSVAALTLILLVAFAAAAHAVEPPAARLVHIKYDDGSTEDHEPKNGVHLADVNGAQDVQGSKVVLKLRGQQLRHLGVTPGKKDTIGSIELVTGRNRTAPIVLAATVEGFE